MQVVRQIHDLKAEDILILKLNSNVRNLSVFTRIIHMNKKFEEEVKGELYLLTRAKNKKLKGNWSSESTNDLQ